MIIYYTEQFTRILCKYFFYFFFLTNRVFYHFDDHYRRLVDLADTNIFYDSENFLILLPCTKFRKFLEYPFIRVPAFSFYALNHYCTVQHTTRGVKSKYNSQTPLNSRKTYLLLLTFNNINHSNDLVYRQVYNSCVITVIIIIITP